MRGLEHNLRSWAAKELRYWEQAALEKISRQGELTKDDLHELVQYFIEDAGLAPIPPDRPSLSLLQNIIAEAEQVPCRLNRIFNLRNVNALPEGQEIRFGPQLTLLFGNNGAGKSGYARALGSAGFARGERKVLPNASGLESKKGTQADIEISYSSGKKVVTWTEGKRCPELSGFYVFEGGSLTAHLTGSNPLSYTPGGLSLLTTLAEGTDLVRENIRILIEKCEESHNFQAFFDGDSQAKNHLANLDAQTDLDALEKLAQLTPEEKTTCAALEREIAELKLLNISKQVEKRRQEIRDLGNLIQALQRAQAELGESVVAEVFDLINKLRSCREAMERSGINQFEFQPFSQIGTDAWRQFVTAAKVLADSEGTRGAAYPRPGDPCLLCRQTLSDEAIDLIERLWAFLSSDAQTQLSRAESACATKARHLDRLNLNYFAPDSNARRILDEELQVAIPALDAQVESCQERCREMQEALRTTEVRLLPPLINFDLTDLKRLVNIRHDEVEQLEKSDTEQRLAKAARTLRELVHRQILDEHFPEIVAYVGRRRWAAKAQQALGSTRAITMKYNELFQELVTERYRGLFEQTLKRFRKDSKVTIETHGSKGETVRHVVLNPKSFRTGFSVDQILSDGEKRAVAMADFLTEAALDEHNSGIILDDPVTSLDDEWKKTLAGCLAELAKARQVVVFTHDLTFLYRIKERAEELMVDAVTHWIREEDGQPGFVYLDNSPVCEKDFKSATKAREYYSKAKDAPPEEQQVFLQQGFGALRTSYEALIIFEIFCEVVGRFEERVSFGRLKDVRVDPRLADEIICRMETLSRYIDAHLHSDKFGSVKPSPAVLLDEISAFDSIRKAQKNLRKTAEQPVPAKKAESALAESENTPKSVADSHEVLKPPAKPSTN
jgi:ABC-type Mn2+/Zn2+ transport system ATPase subunit